MPVFDRFRFIWKFRHRSFRIFSNFGKIFTELGDRAPQSWKDFGNFDNFHWFYQLGRDRVRYLTKKWVKPKFRMSKKFWYLYSRSSLRVRTNAFAHALLIKNGMEKKIRILKNFIFSWFFDDFCSRMMVILVLTHPKLHFKIQSSKIKIIEKSWKKWKFSKSGFFSTHHFWWIMRVQKRLSSL